MKCMHGCFNYNDQGCAAFGKTHQLLQHVYRCTMQANCGLPEIPLRLGSHSTTAIVCFES